VRARVGAVSVAAGVGGVLDGSKYSKSGFGVFEATANGAGVGVRLSVFADGGGELREDGASHWLRPRSSVKQSDFVYSPARLMSAVQVYRKTRKVPDLFWNMYVCRPIAAVLVNALKTTKITPNQVTLSAVFVAVLSAVLLVVLPGYWGLVVAVLVFQFSYVLDCVDGMLARWREIQSTKGHLLDFLMDEIKAFIILASVSVRLFLQDRDAKWLLIGIFGLVALATGIALTTFLRRPEIAGRPADEKPDLTAPTSFVKKIIRLVESFAKLLIHYPSYILYAALLGRIELYLYPYVAVNAVYAARTFLSVTLRFGGRSSHAV
jgi:phosphatidylglycerophosphate synthase